MHIEAKVLPLRIRRNIALLKLLYSTLRDPVYDQSRQSLPKYDTRSSRVINFALPRPRSEGYKKSVTYQGKKRWSELPVSQKNLDSIEEFGRRIKTYCTEEFVLPGVVQHCYCILYTIDISLFLSMCKQHSIILDIGPF